MKLTADHILIPIPKHYAKEMERSGATWSQKEQAWKVPKSVHALDEIEKNLPKLGQVLAFQEAKRQLEQQRNQLKQKKEQEQEQEAKGNLRPYQWQDVQYLLNLPAAGIFNQPRTGKTPTLIATLKNKNTKTNLIITPASLQLNWIKELNKWYPEAYAITYTKTALQDTVNRSKPVCLVISKDTLKRQLDSLKAIQWDTVTVDEAHFLRNRTTAQTKAVYEIGKKARHRYALTGTPTVKHPSDIFGILHFLYPSKFSSYWQFIERYFFTSSNGFGIEIGNPKPHREAELKDILDAMTTQRLRKDVMQWLPNKQRIIHQIEMPKKQQKHYDNMLNDFMTKNKNNEELDAQNVLAQLTRLRQITGEPALLNLDSPSAKTEALLDIIENDLYTESGEPLIVMSMYTSYLNHLKPLITALGKRVDMITGEMTNQQKQQAAEDFQSGKTDVLLCNIISAGTGFTLDRGEVIIFTDKAWNPSDNEQAEDRITPTTEANNHKHTIISLVCAKTIDEHIENVLSKKQNLTAIINEMKSIDTLRKFLYN